MTESPITTLSDYSAACTACTRKRYRIERQANLAQAVICDDCFSVCPACDGQEFTYQRDDRGYEFARQCPVCSTLKRRIQAFNEAAIPHRHANSTFEGFQTSSTGADGSRGEPLGNLNQVRFRLYNWVKGFEIGERGFMLHGQVGTGKTHLLVAAIRHLTLEKGISAKFVEFTHLLSALRREFDQGRGDSSVLAPVIDVPVLAIDELGKGQNTDWQVSIIDEIISKRYNRSLTTLFTTNYPLELDDKLPAGDAHDDAFHRAAVGTSLQQRVGIRVFSRLYDMADFISIDAPDFRRRDTP